MKLTQRLTGSNIRSPRSPTAVYHSLIAAVIKQTIDDVKGLCCDLKKNKRSAADQAMYFILSDNCKYFCFELKIDYEALKDRAVSLYEDYKENGEPGAILVHRVKRQKIFSLTGFKSRRLRTFKPAQKR
jgi:hypothetical protein